MLIAYEICRTVFTGIHMCTKQKCVDACVCQEPGAHIREEGLRKTGSLYVFQYALKKECEYFERFVTQDRFRHTQHPSYKENKGEHPLRKFRKERAYGQVEFSQKRLLPMIRERAAIMLFRFIWKNQSLRGIKSLKSKS